MLGNGLVYEKCVFCGDEFFRCNCFLKVGENSKIAKFDTFFIYIVASSFFRNLYQITKIKTYDVFSFLSIFHSYRSI